MKTKQVLIVIAVLFLGMFLGRIGLSQTGNALKSVVEPGSMTSEASYIIFTDGTTVYARNGTTGEIEFSGTNASTVINNAIGNLVNGGVIHVKQGNYQYSSTILLSQSGISIYGEGYVTVFQYMGTGNAIEVGPGVNDVTLQNFAVEGNAGSKDGIHFDSAYPQDNSEIRISDVRSKDNGGDGFNITRPVEVTLFECKAESNGKNGFEVTDGTTVRMESTWATLNGWYGYFAYGVYTLEIDGTADNNGGNFTAYGSYIVSCNTPKIKLHLEESLSTAAICFEQCTNPVFEDSYVSGKTYGLVMNQNYGGKVSGNEFTSTNYGIYISYGIGPNQKTTIEANTFHNLGIGGNLTGSIIHNNWGFITENSGNATVSNNDWIAHGLATTPSVVTVTPRSNATVWVNNRNATHFQVGVSSGTVTIDWHAEV